jgi:hypothetical protein
MSLPGLTGQSSTPGVSLPDRPVKPGEVCVNPNGTVNLFVCIDVHRPWRKVKVTERRAAEDYAQCMRGPAFLPRLVTEYQNRHQAIENTSGYEIASCYRLYFLPASRS